MSDTGKEMLMEDNGIALKTEEADAANDSWRDRTRPAHFIVRSGHGSVLAVRETKSAAVQFAADYLEAHTDESGVLANPQAGAVYIMPSQERVPR